MTHYAPFGYNEASGSFYPLGHLLGLPGTRVTRSPSISADLTWIPAHILDGPLRARWIQRGFRRVLHTGAICSGYRVRDHHPSVPTVENIWRIPPYLYIRNIISWRYLHYYICRYPRITSRLSVYINPPDPCSNASAVYSHL